MNGKIPDEDLQRIRGFVARTTGLDFPPARCPDLRRGIAAAAKELGFDTFAAFAARLLTGRPANKELESLVNHLTVGETYFFRDKRSFEILADRILPALVRARRGKERRLRIWSAACCTGEEPYSIAITLSRAIPDWKDWDITLLATDINSRFLRKAASGVFGQWSFRDAPGWLRSGFFREIDEGRFEISAEIRQMVRFAQLNLADDAYPSPQNNTDALDVIFCRNVLMYFTEGQARKVIQRLYRAQADGGWLIVGSSELPNVTCVPYVTSNCHGTILRRKNGEALQAEPVVPEAGEFAPITISEPSPPNPVQPPECPSDNTPEPLELNRLAVSFANQGRLCEALDSCEQWIATDRLNSSSHYLRAVILQEQGKMDEAVRSLRTALYLDPNCLQAYVALGNIARTRGEGGEAVRQLKNARSLLRRLRSEDPLPEFEGVAAGRLLQIVDSLIETEAAA